MTESMRGAVMPSSIVAAGPPEGRLFFMAFWGLTDSTQLSGIETAPQGVDCLPDRKTRGRRSDNMTNRMAGEGRTDYSTNGEGNGHGTEEIRGERTGDTPTTRDDRPRTPGVLRDPGRNRGVDRWG